MRALDTRKPPSSQRLLVPQVFANDLEKGVCPADKVVCVVVDECHKTTGNYASVKALREVADASDCACRIVGLSATPGSQPDKIQEVRESLQHWRYVRCVRWATRCAVVARQIISGSQSL